MNKSRLLHAGLIAAVLLTSACARQRSRNTPIVIFPDMDYQGRFEPQGDLALNTNSPLGPAPTPFFPDHRASRRPVEGTVAIGSLLENESFSTGTENGMYIGRNPVKVDMELLSLGQRRFNTYCAPCHDQTGQGRGLIGARSMWLPTNLQEPRTREMNDGEIFNVATMGRRTMPSYRFQVSDHDRWAIVAYVRALQRTSTATVADVPEDRRAELK